MTYPGEGYKMSNYGLKRYTMHQAVEQWKEAVQRETKTCQTHSVADKLVRMRPRTEVEISYFNNNKAYPVVSVYDRTFRYTKGYNGKLKRDDSEYTQAVGINSEEVNKKVPVLSSTVYGQRLPIDLPSRKFVRVGVVQRDFFRVSGVTINPSS